MAPIFSILSVSLVAFFIRLSFAADLDPIVIKGSRFFYKTNGTQFFIKGVAYQASVTADSSSEADSYSDPLADPAGCRRDVPLLQELGTNVIRVYAIKPNKDHSECMQLLADAGIYLIADLSQPSQSINRDDPDWDIGLYDRYTSVIDALAPYNNVIGFFAGNEVSNNSTNTKASAFVKAAVRDMKRYILDQGYRPMGVGYAADDNAEVRANLAAYFDCGKKSERIDFWGYNIYEWCGNSSYERSGYRERTKEFADYDVPVFFAEYGCNAVQPRSFTEVQALYGPKMTPVWSGGIVYMYFQEENDYGLVEVDGSKAKKLPDFTALSRQITKATPKGVKMVDYTPTNTANAPCPTVDSEWEAHSNLPPTPNKSLCSCMMDTIVCRAKPSLDKKRLGPLFSTVCSLSKTACKGIASDETTGVYGPYGMCNPIDRLSWAFHAYYEEQSKRGDGKSACDFKGAAMIQNPKNPGSTCVPVISVAPEETSKGAAGGFIDLVPWEASSVLQMGIYIWGTIIVGMGMILL